jgi:hypothetical protein
MPCVIVTQGEKILQIIKEIFPKKITVFWNVKIFTDVLEGLLRLQGTLHVLPLTFVIYDIYDVTSEETVIIAHRKNVRSLFSFFAVLPGKYLTRL